MTKAYTIRATNQECVAYELSFWAQILNIQQACVLYMGTVEPIKLNRIQENKTGPYF